MKSVLKLLAVLIALAAAYLLLWPTPVNPVAWTAPMAPTGDTFAYNERLKGLERLAAGVGIGPEGVAFDAQGRLYTGYVDGRVMQFSAEGGEAKELANTGGRPLGVTVAGDGSVLIADAFKGLLQLKDGKIEVLSTEADGLAFGFGDDLDVARSNGVVYFSDASYKFGFGHHMEDILEHGPNGRLLAWDPATKSTRALIKDMHFANGVAVGPDEAYVLVNETAEYRVLRYWLKGEKAGTHDVFIDNLPGFPDNITFNGKDRFWLAMAAPRDPLLDDMAGKPMLRKVVARLPAWMQPAPKQHGLAVGLDLDGKVIANLQYAAADAFAPVTSVREQGSWLYFGSLTENAVGRMPLDQALAH